MKRLTLVFALIAIVMPMMNEVWGNDYSETVPGIEWEKKSGVWYIYWGTITGQSWTGDIGNDSRYSRTASIYCPTNENCTTYVTYKASESTFIAHGRARFYVNDITVATNVNKASETTKTILLSNEEQIKYGWGNVEREGQHVAYKEMTVKVLLPLHIDYTTTNSSLATIYMGDFHYPNTISKEIDFTKYIKSYYISQNVTCTLSTANCGDFNFANGTKYATLATPTSSNGDAVYANEGHTDFSIGAIEPLTVVYTPSENPCGSGVPTCTLTISSEFGTKTITIQAKTDETFIFQTNGNWNTDSNWNKNKLPGSTDDVSIQATCSIPSGCVATCNSLEFYGGSIEIDPNGTLVASGTINNTTVSKLKIHADADHAGTVIFNNISACTGGVCENGPYATVDMYIPTSTLTDNNRLWKDYTWRYMGSPVESGSPSAVDYIFQWSEADDGDGDKDGWNECWQQVTNNTITAWTGYAMGSTAAPIHTITGQLTNCDKEVSLAYGSKVHADRGNNLITNSYAAPIDISKMAESDFQGAEATIYFYNSGTHAQWAGAASGAGFNTGSSAGQFQCYPIKSGGQTVGSDIAGFIPSGQAFFVKTKSTEKTVTFRYNTVASQASGKALAPRKQEEFNVLGISVVGTDSLGDLLWLMENDNCSEKFDNGYDGVKMLGVEGTPQLYATTGFGRTAVNVDQTLTGQYIGFMAGKQGVHYTLYFNTDRLEGYESLYLYDTKENKYANIMKGESYTFTGLRSGEEKRFLIVGQRDEEEDEAVVRTGDEQRIEVVGNRALVMGFDGSDAEVRVVDMQGKVVCTWSMKEGPWFELPDLPGGVYVISVEKCQTKFVK